MTALKIPSPPTFPPEVRDFAAERGVADYLPAVWALTERTFPMASSIRPVLDTDPELVGERHVVTEVEVAGLDVSRYADLHWQWSRGLFEVCPAAHVCLFGLHLEVKDTGRVEPVRSQIRDAMRVYERTALGVTTWQPP
jgi:hypothetical protein